MKKYAIFATDVQGLFAVNGDLPFRMKSDLKFFKEITKGTVVIMGVNTWRSLPVKPLPGRINMVLSSTPIEGDCEVYDSLHTALYKAEHFHKTKDCFIIGGAALIESSFDVLDGYYHTYVLEHIEDHKVKKGEPFDNPVYLRYQLGFPGVAPQKIGEISKDEDNEYDALIFKFERNVKHK